MDFITVKAEDIAYFYATHKLVCMVDSKEQKFILDKSLAELEKETDRVQFYKLNRKFLVSVHAIKKIKAYPKSKLLIEVASLLMKKLFLARKM
jgi:DNA-binding LytR/AlgR family response regulator